MSTQKLTSTDAFVVRDLDGETSVGPVRLARKILVDGATLLARSITYQFASLEQKVGGASAGVNAPPGEEAVALERFVAEVQEEVAAGSLHLDPAKGVPEDALSSLRDRDGRSPLYWEHRHELRGLGAAVAADAALGGLDGVGVAVEGFDAAGPALAGYLAERGARVVAVATAAGTVADPGGLAPDALASAWDAHGPQAVAHLGAEPAGPADVFAVDAPVLVVGSRAGVLDHEVAAGVRARAVVPAGPVPVTAKALAVLRRAGTVVLPDFISTAGPVFAMWPEPEADAGALARQADATIRDLLEEVLEHPDGPLLAACYRAESFLATWREVLPFGRPIA